MPTLSREQLQLSELEAFDARAAIGHHLVSVSVGILSLLIALLAPLPLVPFAPTIFFLMGPGHFWYGSRAGGQRARDRSAPGRRRSGGHRVAAPLRCATPRSSASGRSCVTSSRRAAPRSTISRSGPASPPDHPARSRGAAGRGFPLYDELHEGKKYWTLEQRAFRRLDDTGFTLAEMTALYFSRSLVECLAGTPFQRDVKSAFDKLAAALTPGMRQFLDRLPLVIQAKGEGRGVSNPLRATHASRRSSRRRCSTGGSQCGITRSRATAKKEYVLEPYRLVFAQSGLYLVAFVPEYKQLRTFSMDRIQSLSVTEDRFEPMELPEDAFAHSLGVNQGAPERIEIVFEPHIARYVKERVWHPSQQASEDPDGRLTMTLNVCNDWALRSWILGSDRSRASSRRRSSRRRSSTRSTAQGSSTCLVGV
jgi:predicted DNA-binding transcriptional regulator YafY